MYINEGTCGYTPDGKIGDLNLQVQSLMNEFVGGEL